MKNKPFEIFKADDFIQYCELKTHAFLIADEANRILNEIGKRGFTSLSRLKGDKTICIGITKDRYKDAALDVNDTHEALLFLRPIEDEKEECNHLLFCHVMKVSEDITSYKDFTNTFCPKCGDKLE